MGFLKEGDCRNAKHEPDFLFPGEGKIAPRRQDHVWWPHAGMTPGAWSIKRTPSATPLHTNNVAWNDYSFWNCVTAVLATGTPLSLHSENVGSM